MKARLLPAGPLASLCGALAGLLIVALLLLTPQTRATTQQRAGTGATDSRDRGVQTLGTLGTGVGSERLLSRKAEATKAIAVIQMKFNDVDGTAKSIVILEDHEERCAIIEECLRSAISRADGTGEKIAPATIRVFYRLIQDAKNAPAGQCACYARLYELRHHADSPSNDAPTLASIEQAATSSLSAIGEPTPVRAAALSAWAVVFAGGGFIITNLLAALLGELGRKAALAFVKSSDEKSQPDNKSGEVVCAQS